MMVSMSTIGCAVQQNTARPVPDQSPGAIIDYVIIYLLHADADYLYHSEEGNPLQADKEVLKEAQSVAENAGSGEVFIFHQRPEQKVLWLFPKKDRRMYHYRNGEIVNRISYSPIPSASGEGEEEGGGSEDSAFAAESMLYETYRTAGISGDSFKQILLYYGHEIPMQARPGYHRSRPEVYFGSSRFADGVARFKDDGSGPSPIDLMVLSTCNNGTPDMLHRLADTAGHVLASPQNLHLSHIDSDSLSVLESRTSTTPAELAAILADQTLGRMSRFIQTGVTLSLYDTDVVGDYVQDMSRRITGQGSVDKQAVPALDAGEENIDCADLLTEQRVTSSGIKVWFQPPAFGPQSSRKSHSGWGCADAKS